MIRLDNISKQNGHQILFIDASMGIQKGEKVGLVRPSLLALRDCRFETLICTERERHQDVLDCTFAQ